jgi:maltose/moltooligosaccharide transporter
MPHPISVSHSASGQKIYRCGSLTYTSRHLAILFFWLLWGDFCYVLMESVVPSIMPLKFKSLEASNTSMGLVLVTIPMIISTIFNPVISFKSDRFRSRWGRRIPFILFTMPFLVLCLIGLGYGDSVGHWLHQASGPLLKDVAPNTIAVCVIGAIMVLFSFFNTFVNSVFWYLFNDVVPEALLARFMSWFRMVSLGSVSLYNLFIFPWAGTHSREILIGAGILYFVGFGLMCLNIKEGSYPPPPPNLDGKVGLLSAIKTFGKECHSHWHYWYMFLGTMSSTCATAIGTFMLFFYQGTGLSLSQVGKILSTISVTTGLLILVSGWLADRYHPIRVVIAGQVMQLVLVLPAMCVWIFWHPSADIAFWGWMAISIGLTGPAAALIGVSDPPLLMRIFPRERYGQFCSANAMWRSAGAIVGGVLSGVFLDLVKRYSSVTNVYAFIPVWQFIFMLPVVFCIWKMYGSWKRYGGDASYVAPLPTGVAGIMPESVAVAGNEAILRNAEVVAQSAGSHSR